MSIFKKILAVSVLCIGVCIGVMLWALSRESAPPVEGGLFSAGNGARQPSQLVWSAAEDCLWLPLGREGAIGSLYFPKNEENPYFLQKAENVVWEEIPKNFKFTLNWESRKDKFLVTCGLRHVNPYGEGGVYAPISPQQWAALIKPLVPLFGGKKTRLLAKTCWHTFATGIQDGPPPPVCRHMGEVFLESWKNNIAAVLTIDGEARYIDL